MKESNNNGTLLIILAFLLVIVISGLVWLSQGSGMPPVQKVERVIPDDHLPR